MARRVINDVEAKHLIEKLNRRMGAIEFLTGEHFSWQVWLVESVVIVLMTVWLYVSGRREDWLLYTVVLALCWLVPTYNAGVNKRIDALIELLRQEGMLHTEVPPGSDQES
jgi:hypothetical protein